MFSSSFQLTKASAAWLCACLVAVTVNAERVELINDRMLPDRSQYMSRYGPQLAIAVNSHMFKFEARGPGGLRLSLMHTVTDFSYYISIVIKESEVVIGECRNDNTLACVTAKSSEQPGILFEMEAATFWLSFDNDTVELRGGYMRRKDDVLLTWTTPRGLSWVRLLAVGVHFQADTAPHYFSVYRDVARVKAGEGVNVTSPRSPSELLNGTYVTVVQSSSSSPFYVDDPVTIVYAVGNYMDAFSYRLHVGTYTVISLSHFGRSADWPSPIPSDAVGGDIFHRFPQPGVYRIVFSVSGQATGGGNEESTEVETTVTVSGAKGTAAMTIAIPVLGASCNCNCNCTCN